MVTCNHLSCRRRKDLDEDGFCPQHTTQEVAAETDVHSCKCGGCNETVQSNPDTKRLLCDSENCKAWYHLNCTSIK